MKKQVFTDGWLFAKEGETLAPVMVPHDAMLHQKRAAGLPGGSAQAWFPGGRYVYEKTFVKPEAEHVLLQFEGVYKNAKVSINGKEAGGCDYGYLPFFVCADGLLQEGENTIRVECDNADQPDSRWYSGAGIYRPVWMWTGPAASIGPESVKIQTVSTNPAKIRVITGAPGEVSVEILAGKVVVASGVGNDLELAVPNARLWSDETPYLYTCRVKLGEDEHETRFGIRSLEWSNRGIFVNGKETLLRGGCIHHDNGVLGAATWDESEYRRVKILKEAGFNAIRSAHNPVSRAMLEACDELGLYIMDESWDMWFRHKSKYDYAGQWRQNYLSDLQAMVERDYNHPSVIMYSIGNEVSEPAADEGVEKAREMVDFLHRADPTRMVTGGFNLMIIANSKKGKSIYKEEGGMEQNADKSMNSTMFNLVTSMIGSSMNKAANSKAADAATSPGLDTLDVAGYNYASGRYPLESKAHPDRIVVGSETFPQELPKNWAMVKQYPYLVGDFMWTAWDYLGEAGIGAWHYEKDGLSFNKPYPWLIGGTGVFDILGNPTGEAYLTSAVWGRLSAPAIAVRPVNHPGVRPAKSAWRGTNSLPSWSWNGCDGNKAIVEVFTDADTVKLLLNGKSLGKKKVKAFVASFKVKYESGELKAVSYDAKGNREGESKLVSASGKLGVQLNPEKSTARPGEVVYVDVSIADKNGIVEANADTAITIKVEGGTLLGFGSANPRTEERFDSGTYKTFYGKAQAVLLVGSMGMVKVTAKSQFGETEVLIATKRM